MKKSDNPLPLYYRLYEILRKQIENGDIAYGEKLESESMMMRRYDIGRLTVRSALSKLVNMGYLEKVQGKGTFCCYRPSTDEPTAVDVLLNIGDTYFIPYYLKSISRVFNDENYSIHISDTKDSSEEIRRLLTKIADSGSNGIILQPDYQAGQMSPELEASLEHIKNVNIPLVMIDSVYPMEGLSCVCLDEFKGGKIAGDYLLSLKHDKAAIIYLAGHQDALLRRSGFLHTYMQNNKPVPREYHFQEGGFQPLIRDFKAGLFSAVFCYNDEMASNLLHKLKENGIRVPQDLSVLGFDDSVLAPATAPPLTSISHPKQLLGEETAHLLIEFIQKKRQEPYQRLFVPDIAIRNSCIQNLH